MKTVLIAEDEELFLSSLVEELSAFSKEFTLLTARNGAEAIQVLSSRQVDLVLTDLKMPIMDGFQLLAYIMQRHPVIPIIVMTAFGTPEIEDQVEQSGGLKYLEKPIDFHLLAEEIGAALSPTTKGHIEGITLASFLQLLQIEKKNCALTIKSQGRKGYLYFLDGELSNAIYQDCEGELAAYEIVAWEDPEIEIENVFRKKKSIYISLHHILIEAARLKDESKRSENVTDDGFAEVEPVNDFTFPLEETSVTDDYIYQCWNKVSKDLANINGNLTSYGINLIERKVIPLSEVGEADKWLEQTLNLLETVLYFADNDSNGVFEYVADGIAILLIWDLDNNLVLVVAGSLPYKSATAWFRTSAAAIAKTVLAEKVTNLEDKNYG